jgi:hypothetical protein
VMSRSCGQPDALSSPRTGEIAGRLGPCAIIAA